MTPVFGHHSSLPLLTLRGSSSLVVPLDWLNRLINLRREICLSLGVDSPSEVLFLTDLLPEAEAAKLAGVRAVLSVRPGNEPLPDVSVAAGHGFSLHGGGGGGCDGLPMS